MIRKAAVLLALTISLGACAGTAPEPGSPAPGSVRRNQNLITATELDQPAFQAMSLYDAIQRLRPTWLRQRTATSVMNASTVPAVLVNDTHSTIDALYGFKTSDVTSVEYMSGTDATTQYGTGYGNGVIKVKTRGGTDRR